MIEHCVDLLPGQFESEQFEQKTVGRGHYATCCNTTNLEREREREREREEKKRREERNRKLILSILEQTTLNSACNNSVCVKLPITQIPPL